MLHRSTRGVSLTDAGELYAARVTGILQQIEDTESDVIGLGQGSRGLLRLSSPPSFGTHVLTPIITQFARDNDGMSVNLGLQDDEPDVIASRLDILFRLGVLRDSTLVARLIAHAPFVLCAAPTYIEQHGLPHEVSDLPRFNCLIDGSVQVDGSWTFTDSGNELAEQVVSGNFASVSTEAVIEAVTSGLGIAYVPRYAIVDELRDGHLRTFTLDDAASIELPVYALYGSREHLALKIKLFLDYVVSHIDAADGLVLPA